MRRTSSSASSFDHPREVEETYLEHMAASSPVRLQAC
jgi:hypothetical protein